MKFSSWNWIINLSLDSSFIGFTFHWIYLLIGFVFHWNHHFHWIWISLGLIHPLGHPFHWIHHSLDSSLIGFITHWIHHSLDLHIIGFTLLSDLWSSRHGIHQRNIQCKLFQMRKKLRKFGHTVALLVRRDKDTPINFGQRWRINNA